MKNIPSLFFIVLILLLLLIVGIWTTTPPTQATGAADVTFQTLQKSGDTVASQPTIKWLAYFFGFGIISLFSLGVFIGAKKKDKAIQKNIYQVLGIGTVLYLAVYTCMVFSWWEYVATNSMDYFMGLPKPTAWLFFGLMFIPIFMSFFYITKFEKWIFNEADMVEFKKIIERRKQ